mgnify:CR=1 FL=1
MVTMQTLKLSYSCFLKVMLIFLPYNDKYFFFLQMNLMNQNTDPLSIPLCPNDQQILSSESYEYKVNVRTHSQDIVSLKVADENVTKPKEELSKEVLMSNIATKIDSNGLKTRKLMKLLDEAFSNDLNKTKKCHVPKCTTRENRGFYTVPEHPKRREEYLNACKMPPSTKDLKVCWKHFLPSDFKNEIDEESIAQFRFGSLKKNVVPSRNLPQDSDLTPTIPTDYSISELAKKNEIEEDIIAQLRHGNLNKNVVPNQNLPKDSDVIKTNAKLCKKEQKYEDLCFTDTDIQEVLDNENFSKKKSSNFNEDIMENLEFSNCDNQKVLELPSRNLPEDSELIIRNDEVCKKEQKYVDLHFQTKDSLEVLSNKKVDEKENLNIKEEIMETLSNSLKLQNFEKIKNPWMVDNASVFLKYCCPECEFSDQDLQVFSDHAIENHKDAFALFPIEHLIVDTKDAIPLKLQEGCESCSFVECVCNANSQNDNLNKIEKLATGNHADDVDSFPVEKTLEDKDQENSSEIPKECGECEFGQCVCFTKHANTIQCTTKDTSKIIEYKFDSDRKKHKRRIQRIEHLNYASKEVKKQPLCEVCPILQLSSIKEVTLHRREIHMKDKSCHCQFYRELKRK